MTGDEVYRVFLEAAGRQDGDLGDVRYALEQVIAQLSLSQPTPKTAVKAQAQSDSNSDSTLVTVLKNGLGVAPLVGGLISLFSGGSEEPAPFVKYAMPDPVNIQAADRGGRITTADYDQMGMARGASATTVSGAQITVNVQAMDARSFMDRSGDIAMAVRDAMLNLNPINDVVNDL